MSEAKYTPGPWKVGSSINVQVGRKNICSRVNCASREAVSITESMEIAKANARLIAAAPELLEALKKRTENEEQRIFEEWLSRECPSGDHDEVNRKWLSSSDYIDFCDEWEIELDAIAKATGKA